MKKRKKRKSKQITEKPDSEQQIERTEGGSTTVTDCTSLSSPTETLKDKLAASRFRFINEQLYSISGKEAVELFAQDNDAFSVYHRGYARQVKKWPINPVDVVIRQLKALDKSLIVVDMGCGEAKLATSVPQTVHSFDLVAVNDNVTACDMAKVPLDSETADICVFCLSLMGTNLNDYVREANRILRKGGLLKIVEINSRIQSLRNFVRALDKMGFSLQKKKLLNDMFCFLEFTKLHAPRHRRPMGLQLIPCLYKKR